MYAAVIQMVSGPDVSANLTVAGELLEEAAAQGASLAVLPENFGYVGLRQGDILNVTEPEGSGPIQDFLSARARSLKLWIVGGSLPLSSATGERAYASCQVYDPQGCCVVRYDKLHLFDVGLPDSQERYRESATYLPGGAAKWVDTGAGRLGLSICYDLRFPELYRHLGAEGVELISVPSAFTQTTGEVHWELLLRARAVENLAYVLAANQGGRHAGGRETYGDSMIVDPWGKVLARLDKGEGVACAEIDLSQLHALRQNFPALNHRRIGTQLKP